MAFILFSFHFFGKKGGIIIHTYIYDSPPAPCPLSPIGNLTMVSMLMVPMLLANAVEGQHSLGYGESWGSAQGR